MFTFSEKTRQIGVFPQKILFKQTLAKITILLSAIFRIVLNFGNRSRESSDFSCILSQAIFPRAVRGPLTSYRSEPRFEPPLNFLLPSLKTDFSVNASRVKSWRCFSWNPSNHGYLKTMSHYLNVSKASTGSQAPLRGDQFYVPGFRQLHKCSPKQHGCQQCQNEGPEFQQFK